MPRYITRTSTNTLYNKTLDAATCTVTGITNTPLDGTLFIVNTSVATKKLAFDLSGATAATVMTIASPQTAARTLTLPDATDTLVGKATTDTLTNKTLTSPKVGTAINDTNGNEIIKTPATASAVNEFTITNAIAGTAPILGATGGDTHVGVMLDAKGTAAVMTSDPFCPKMTVTADTTAGAITYTAASIVGGILFRDPNGAGRTDVTPTAALLLAAVPGAIVGTTVRCTVINNADGNETITLSAGSGGTLKGQASQTTIVQNAAKELLFVFTNVTTSSESYDLYVR